MCVRANHAHRLRGAHVTVAAAVNGGDVEGRTGCGG